MRPRVTVRKKGEAPKPPSYADEEQSAALDAAAAMLLSLCPSAQFSARRIAEWTITAHILKLCELQYKDPRILDALSSERPWGMVRLIDKSLEEEAAILSALPIVGDLVAEMDPEGAKPLFAYSKDEIVRLFEAVIWCWEETRAERTQIKFPDTTVPF